MNASKTCLITGGAGFIGSHLCRALLSKNYRVVCLDNFLTGNKKNIAELLEKADFQFIEHDVTKPVEIAGDLDYIYHLASPASPIQYKKYSIETLMANSVGTYNMLNLSVAKKAAFLLASTSEIYGDPAMHPQNEDYWGNVNPVGPRACYDESKRFAEALTMEFIRKNKLNARIVRIFNTYGPMMEKDDGRVISNFINQALENFSLTVYGDGKQTRSFCYVTDMVEGIIKAMEAYNSKGDIFNLGNPDERRIIDIAHLILQTTSSGAKISYRPLPENDPMRRKPDISRAQNILGWQPKTDLARGLKNTVDYFRNL